MLNLLLISMSLLCALLMTRLMNHLHMPDVTAYLVTGVVLGPCVLGRLGIAGLGFSDFAQVDSLSLINDVALGFIAFAIGHEFRLSSLRQTGRQATVVGVLQAVTATLTVDVALLLLHLLRPELLSVAAAITLGAIAAATAPAATLMVVRQYKAKGAVTDILLPVLALDDAVGLVVFAVSFGAAQSISSGSVDTLRLIVEPLAQIVLSLLLGSAMGALLTVLERYFHSNRNRLALIVSFIVLTVALSQLSFQLGRFVLGFSPLLVCMMLGTVFCNFCPLSEELMDLADRWSAPVLTLFFVLSGAKLQLDVFASGAVLLVGAVYILSRSCGKIVGARFSSRLVHCESNVQKYLGITLLPQAGVALGMCDTAGQQLGADGAMVRNIVLFGVLIYELVGPYLTKTALIKSGDIQSKSPAVEHRRAEKLRKVSKPMPRRSGR